MRKDTYRLGLLRNEGGTLACYRQQYDRTHTRVRLLLRADVTFPKQSVLGCHPPQGVHHDHHPLRSTATPQALGCFAQNAGALARQWHRLKVHPAARQVACATSRPTKRNALCHQLRSSAKLANSWIRPLTPDKIDLGPMSKTFSDQFCRSSQALSCCRQPADFERISKICRTGPRLLTSCPHALERSNSIYRVKVPLVNDEGVWIDRSDAKSVQH